MNVWLKKVLCQILPIIISLIGSISAHAQTVVYFHNDPAGSPIAATDASGNVLWRESYRPYGERMLKPAAANTQWFHGKSLDLDTGMEDFGARNYDPVLGRFLSIDPVDFTEKNIHSFNRYAYGNNNPLKYKDPDGRVAFLLPLVAALSEVGLATAVRLTATAAGRYVVSGATAIAAAEVGAPVVATVGSKVLPSAAVVAQETALAAAIAGREGGAAAALRVGKRTFTAVSGEATDHASEVTAALMATPRSSRAPWHGGCAEAACYDKAFKAGVNPEGGTISAANIGGSANGTYKPACLSCQFMNLFFKVNEVTK